MEKRKPDHIKYSVKIREGRKRGKVKKQRKKGNEQKASTNIVNIYLNM